MSSFKVNKDEYLVAILIFVLILLLNILIISKFFILFANFNTQSWNVFMRNYHMSGFDPITYSVVTNWRLEYNTVRHPLLPFMMYPLYIVNHLLWIVTGVNCAQIVIGFLLVFCSFFSFLFLYRIIHDIMDVSRLDAVLLTMFFGSFAYVMVTIIVPDHFFMSLFLILYTIYIAGNKIKQKQNFSVMQMTILFVITAGVTLSNGIIILFIVLLTNGWKNFNIKYICSALLLLLTMLGIGFVLNSETLVSGPQSVIGWMDVSTPRYDVLVENFFGESIQLHSKNVLGDVLVRRPVIVKYTWGGQYAIEYVVILLLLIGIYYGRRSKLLWLNVACLLYSILLHFVIGFAIKEVYIMSAHWIYVIPMSVAFIFKRWSTKVLPIRVCIIILTSYLWVYNGYLLYNYLTWPLSYR